MELNEITSGKGNGFDVSDERPTLSLVVRKWSTLSCLYSHVLELIGQLKILKHSSVTLSKKL